MGEYLVNMPGTILCKVGKGCTTKANAIIFPLEGEFLRRDLQPQKMVNEFIESKREDKLIGYDNKTESVDATNIDNTLYACPLCCAQVVTTTESNILGCLTLAGHIQYR